MNIIYIMGKSSTGKDTIKNKLLDKINSEATVSTKEIVLYTTREKRENEINGRDYNFVTENEYTKLYEDEKVIECRTYKKVQGSVRYFTVAQETNNTWNIGIGTLESYNSIKEYYKNESNIIPVYLEVNDQTRLLRAIERENKESLENRNYEEICRRFIADEKDFSENNLIMSGIERKFINNNIVDVVEEIFNYIFK